MQIIIGSAFQDERDSVDILLPFAAFWLTAPLCCSTIAYELISAKQMQVYWNSFFCSSLPSFPLLHADYFWFYFSNTIIMLICMYNFLGWKRLGWHSITFCSILTLHITSVEFKHGLWTCLPQNKGRCAPYSSEIYFSHTIMCMLWIAIILFNNSIPLGSFWIMESTKERKRKW